MGLRVVGLGGRGGREEGGGVGGGGRVNSVRLGRDGSLCGQSHEPRVHIAIL